MIYTLITNQLSGHYSENTINKFVKQLKTQHNITVNVVKINKVSFLVDFVAQLKQNEKHCLIFACGDGTINFTINEIVKRDDIENFTITVIPMGTANVFSKELNISNYRDTIKSIIENNCFNMILCNINNIKNGKNSVFFLMASVGYDSMAVYNLNDNLKKKFGKLAYIIAFIKTIFTAKNIDLTVQIDSQQYKCVNVMVQNGKYYGGKFKIANTTVDKDYLEAVVIKKLNLFSILKYLMFKKSNNITAVKCKNLTITTDNSNQTIYSEIDGDLFCETPVEISMLNKKIKVLKKL